VSNDHSLQPEVERPGEVRGPISVVLADDQALMRMGFRMVLEAEDDINVVGEASDGTAALAQAKALHPDVILMDVRMPGMNGIEATELIARECPGTRVLILTTFDLDEYAFAGLRAGARIDSLTPREKEILVLMSQGMSNAEIADRLVVSATTVKTHVGNVLAKLDVRDRVQAVVVAYETGLMA